MRSYEMKSEHSRLEEATLNIVRKMLISDPDLKRQLDEEQVAMEKEACIDATLGSYLDDDEVYSLIDVILNASSEYFSFRFPELKSLNGTQRRDLAISLKDHFEKCRHCALKLEYLEKWQGKVDNARDAVLDHSSILESNDGTQENGDFEEVVKYKEKVRKALFYSFIDGGA